jgi:hypothetical protein
MSRSIFTPGGDDVSYSIRSRSELKAEIKKAGMASPGKIILN